MTGKKVGPFKRIAAVYFILTIAMGNVILFTMQSEVSQGEQLMAGNDEGGGMGFPVYTGVNYAQGFEATSDYTLTRVSLFVMDLDPIDNDLSVEIYDNNEMVPGDPFDDIPGASISATATANGDNSVFQWLDFSFSLPLTGEQRYWIVASSIGSDIEGYIWMDSMGDFYPFGHIASGGNPVWLPDPGNDMWFKVYGELGDDVGVQQLSFMKREEIFRKTQINATIKNYGTNPQFDFDVICEVWDPLGSLILDEIKNIPSLGSGASTDLTWTFTPLIDGEYFISVATLLMDDEYPFNDMASGSMIVEAPAILKLHSEITVNGLRNDWKGKGPAMEDTWQTSRREYIWKDAEGDDTGDGDYVYPTDPRYESGCLDLLEFRTCTDADSINFLLEFASIDDGEGDGTEGILGFSEQIIEILIDMDRDGTGRTDSLRNARMKVDQSISWEYALWVDGWGNGYLENEAGDIYEDIITAMGSPLSNVVEISIPAMGPSIPDFKVWRYVVLIGAQDDDSLPNLIGGSASGFRRVDLFESHEAGGGGEDAMAADPNVYDMAFAFPQDVQLGTYGMEDVELISFTDTSGVSGANIDSDEFWAQSFKAPFTCLLSGMGFYARDIGPDSMIFEFSILANNDLGDENPNNDIPKWEQLSSTEFMDFDFSYEWRYAPFSNPPVLRKGETYWIAAICPDPGSEGYQWGKKTGNPWPGGASAVWNGFSWTRQSDDLLFQAMYRDLANVDASQATYFAPLVINALSVNGSASDEWVEIYYNGTGSAPSFDMTNWTLSDQDGNVFVFDSFILNNGETVTVHSGMGSNSSKALYWNSPWEVWDDFGDDVLLNSSNMLPVDYMNYTDYNILGDPPPWMINWGPENFEPIPPNPENRQSLILTVAGRDNDIYQEWSILAQGKFEIKTLYFFDDETYDAMDPEDYMNTTPPTTKTVVNVDGDPDPGLSFWNSGSPTDPRRFHEFHLTPILAGEFNIAGNVDIELWVDDSSGESSEKLTLTLLDCNSTTQVEISNITATFTTDKFSGWELATFTIPDIEYTLEREHWLVLHILLDSSSEEDLWLAYNATEYASCIRELPTRTYVRVEGIRTLDQMEIEKSEFVQGEPVIIRANVSDPLGSYDILEALVTIIPPGPGAPLSTFMTLYETDSSDPSAWKVFTHTFFGATEPGVYTVEVEGVESNGVTHMRTIYFTVLNNTKPQLTEPDLVPPSGYASDSFNFTVKYTDAENDPPGVVTVNITGLDVYDLLELDPADSDYTDGKYYYLELTGFVNSTVYSYHFAANDTKGMWNETGEFLGPQILNTPPILFDMGVTPPSGNATTSFNFTVNYTDLDNQPPTLITVNITGPSHAGSWALVEVDPLDTDYQDGKLYYHVYQGFINGSYSYHFAAKDTQDAWDETAESSAPVVINSPPVLEFAAVLPISGYITTEFNYTVTYYDIDDHAPAEITVNISGPSHSGSWVMIEVDPSDTNYQDGKEYYHSYTGLTIGSYSFHCAARDTQDDWDETSEISDPDVLNTRPTLSDHNLAPTVGDSGSTVFNYTVKYTDLDDQAPATISVNITGPFTGNFSMVELDPSDTDYTDGKFYYFQTTLPLDGTYEYRMDAQDTGGLWAITILDTGPNVGSDAPPVLSQPRVIPGIGITLTWFNFTVNFTDFQNDSADVILLNLSGPSGGLFVMMEVDPDDTNTTDGKYFYYNMSGLEKGSYSFFVEGNDTNGNYTQSAVRNSPTVRNSPPQLLGSFINESNYGESWFNFTLVYSDIDNDFPGSVNLKLVGMGNLTMNELDPSDVLVTDGKEYFYNLTIPKGSYPYRFEAVDSGFGMKWNHTFWDVIDLFNNIPIFLWQQVIPPTGFGGESFNFSVEVSDLDADTLIVNLQSPGVPGSPWSMEELDPLDLNTADGKEFFFNMSISKGSYLYNFSVFDGDDLKYSIDEWLNVSNNPPVIITVDITTSVEDVLYSVDYNYTDLDGDPISWDIDTNATWLSFDYGTGLLSGTPNNLHVGNYYVNVSVDDGDSGLDYHYFILDVVNTLPLFSTIPDIFAQEDILHLDDFNCIDDGQGSIVYSLLSNATWLSMDPGTGLLSGTPDNTEVGWYWVNATVNDGNGGVVSVNYTLTVNNTLPSISTIPITQATEDMWHLDDFNCDDDNQGNIQYSLDTNATWLSLSQVTGILSGIPDNTNVGSFWLNVSVSDGNGGIAFINYTLTVLNVPPQITNTPDITAVEDSIHIDDFDCTDDGFGNITYYLATNATWLSLQPITGVLTGTPDNSDVGMYFVNVSVSDGNGGWDYVEYNLTVSNNLPSITTTPSNIAQQDIPFTDDFNCDDDGQGNITYFLISNATWLTFNSTTGVLSGLPNNTHIGWYWVNMSVTDGNGGMDSENYTLTVDDVNDPPQITTENLEFADEDALYWNDYGYIDIDDMNVSWQLETNATWLAIDPGSGNLSGTPQNDHVGWVWVNVSVSDGRGGSDYTNFTVSVNNTDPFITTVPLNQTLEDGLFIDDFDCDDDSQGTITYSLLSNASWLSLDPLTGILSGTPNNTQVGVFLVIITVDDGNGGNHFISYDLYVQNEQPFITTTPITSTDEDSPFLEDFACEDDGQGTITYHLDTDAAWLTLDETTGVIYGIPDNDDVGSYWLNISVADGNGGIQFLNYTLDVQNTNDAPEITTTDYEFAVEDTEYLVDYEFTDVDDDPVSWSVTTNATWLSMDTDSGVLTGTPRNQDVGWFFVNITAFDGSGGFDYTSFVVFVDDTNDPPAVPMLLEPSDDSNVDTTSPTFSWGQSQDPDRGDSVVSYTLQYSTTSDFSDDITTVSGITETSYTVAAPLADKTLYYWRVEAYDSNAQTSGFQTTHFVFSLDTGYSPPSYSGGIKSASIDLGETWSIDLDEYFDLGSVTENLTFSSNYDAIIIDPETHTASWTPQSKNVMLLDVVFTMQDGTTNVSSSPIDLAVEKEVKGMTFLERIWWPFPLIPLALLLALAGIWGYKKRKERAIVEEVFFISENGRLIAHASVLTEEDIDEEILSSMLTGVKDFVSDAFIRGEGKEDKGLNKLEFGEKSIWLEKGNHFFMALVFTGKGTIRGLDEVMEEIEERYGEILKDWDGDMKLFEGADDIIERLLPLEEFTEEEKDKIKEARGKDKVIEKWEGMDEGRDGDPSIDELRRDMGWD